MNIAVFLEQAILAHLKQKIHPVRNVAHQVRQLTIGKVNERPRFTGASDLTYLLPDYDYLKRNNTPIFVLSKGSSVLLQTEGVSMESWPKEQKRLFSKLFKKKKTPASLFRYQDNCSLLERTMGTLGRKKAVS